MGLDALDDNIISDESADDNKELFDANEFIDLNEDTDPDMVLHYSPGKLNPILSECPHQGLLLVFIS